MQLKMRQKKSRKLNQLHAVSSEENHPHKNCKQSLPNSKITFMMPDASKLLNLRFFRQNDPNGMYCAAFA